MVLVSVTLRTRRRASVGLRGARSRSFDAINYWPLARQSIVDTIQIQSTKYFLIQSITDPRPDNPNLIWDDLTFTISWCYCTMYQGLMPFTSMPACNKIAIQLITSECGIWVGKVKIDCINVINYMAIWKTGQHSTYALILCGKSIPMSYPMKKSCWICDKLKLLARKDEKACTPNASRARHTSALLMNRCWFENWSRIEGR